MSEKTNADNDDASAYPHKIPETLTPGVELEVRTSNEKEWHHPSPPTLDPKLLGIRRKLVEYSSSSPSSSSSDDDEERKKFYVQWGGGKGGVVKTRLQERREREKPPPTESDGNDDNLVPIVVEGDGDNLGLPLVPFTTNDEDDDNGDNLALPNTPIRENSHREGTPDPPALSDDPNPVIDIERGESSRDVERKEREDDYDDDVQPTKRQNDSEKKEGEEYFVIRPAATKIFKKHAAKTFSFTPVNFDESGLVEPPSIDYATQLDNLRRTVIEFLTREIKRHYPRGVKVHLSASVRFRVVRDEEVVDRPIYHFSVKSQLILHLDEVSVVIGDIIRQLGELIADRKDRGSNFVFDTITDAQLTVLRFAPTKGGFYCRLPISISKKRATLNVDTSGDEETEKRCILYAILAHLYPVTTNRNRASSYRQNLPRLRYEGIQFPAGRKEIDQLEKLNERLSINVFAFETLPHNEKTPTEKRQKENTYQFFPWRLSKNRKLDAIPIDLLLIQNPEAIRREKEEPDLDEISRRRAPIDYDHHYVLITNLGRLTRTANSNSHRTSTKVCRFCLSHFTNEEAFQNHDRFCRDVPPQAIVLPNKGEVMQFSANRSRHRSPFIISLDFETRICKVPGVAQRVETALPPGAARKFNWITFESENRHALQCSKCVATKPCSEIQQSTEIMSHLSIFSFCYKIISASGKHDYPLRVNQSPNCAEEFLRSLKEDMTDLYAKLRVNNPITISDEQLRQFRLQERCGICSTKFSDLPKSFKHRDHDHLEVGDLQQW